MDQESEREHGNYTTYLIGFIACLIITLLAFYIVSERILDNLALELTVVALCLIQAAVQMRFFLHLGLEPRPHWKSLSFLFMVLVVVVIVFGSLWIMHNLDSRMMQM